MTQRAERRRIGLILLSGGLDSTTLACLAKRDTDALHALTLNYGQRHIRELDSARRVAEHLGIGQQVVDVSFYGNLAAHSALTDSAAFDLPTSRDEASFGQDVPITYVPLRNTFFSTLAAAVLESRVLDAIETDGLSPTDLEPVLFIGANALDYSGYPDCRPDFYSAITETFRLGSKIGTEYDCPIRIETPLIDKTKADIVNLAVELDAPLALTWSCYSDRPQPCGVCDSCHLRAKGFAEAGIPDPALEA